MEHSLWQSPTSVPNSLTFWWNPWTDAESTTAVFQWKLEKFHNPSNLMIRQDFYYPLYWVSNDILRCHSRWTSNMCSSKTNNDWMTWANKAFWSLLPFSMLIRYKIIQSELVTYLTKEWKRNLTIQISILFLLHGWEAWWKTKVDCLRITLFLLAERDTGAWGRRNQQVLPYKWPKKHLSF